MGEQIQTRVLTDPDFDRMIAQRPGYYSNTRALLLHIETYYCEKSRRIHNSPHSVAEASRIG